MAIEAHSDVKFSDLANLSDRELHDLIAARDFDDDGIGSSLREFVLRMLRWKMETGNG